MTPRPPTPIGHYGTISTKKLPSGVWEARARYRAASGRSVDVRARGASKIKATNALKQKFEDQTRSRAGEFTADSRLAEVLRWWVEHHDGISERSRHDYSAIIERNLVPRCGDVRLREVTTSMVDQVIRDILEKRSVQTTVNGRRVTVTRGGQHAAQHALVCLSGAFSQVVRWDILPANPVSSARRVRRDRKEVVALDAEELRELRSHVHAYFAAPGKYGLPRVAATWFPQMLDLLIATGCRVGEVVAAQWRDFDLTEGTFTVQATMEKIGSTQRRKESPKTESSVRTLVLPESMVHELRQRKLASESEWVFATVRGGPPSLSVVSERLHEAAPEHLQHVTPHMLRRSVATLIERSASAEAASLQLGHRDEGVTRKHYIVRRRLSDASSVLGAVLEG